MEERLGVDEEVKKGTTEGPEDRAVYIISVAAELAGVHPQTLRIYERKGLLTPARTKGNTRRYSERDIARLRMIQRMTQDDGLNLAGVKIIVDLQMELERVRVEAERLSAELTRARTQERAEGLRAGRRSADIVPLSAARRVRLFVSRNPTARPEGSEPIPLGPVREGRDSRRRRDERGS